MLSFSSLGYSLPDLVTSGFSSPLAAWGGPIAVNLNVSNLGSNTVLQPLSLQPGAATTADAGPFSVSVALIANPGTRFARSVSLGSVSFTGLAQNSSVNQTANFQLPSRPRHFPNYGGNVYLQLVANPNGAVAETDMTNNVFLDRQDPIKIVTPAAAIRVVGVDVPSVLQPGDTISPNIRLANYGALNSAVGGPLIVELVASRSPVFNSGVSVVARYTVDQIQPQSLVPTQNFVIGDANLTPPLNFETITGTPVTLPIRPHRYFLGVVVNPSEQAGALAQVNKTLLIAQVREVGPPIPGLPPAGVIGQPITPFPKPFPFPNAPTLNTP